ncbi:hypothetical protein HZC53_06245 [Candidatus Uhrbacteria bacterium]|nr:hypothetical protein [Candidatus Uhrbacteria bacterium]
MKFEAGPSKEKPNKLLEGMQDRTGWASEKVQEAMNNRFLKRFSKMDEDEIEHELDRLEGDFYVLAENPDSPDFGGRYAGWSGEEIKELFSVMYGRELGSSKKAKAETKKESLSDALNMRLEDASPKVKQRVLERFMPRLQKFGEDEFEIFLDHNENSFLSLAIDPEDESGGGHYEGWTADETKELYRVLYGKEPEG